MFILSSVHKTIARYVESSAREEFHPACHKGYPFVKHFLRSEENCSVSARGELYEDGSFSLRSVRDDARRGEPRAPRSAYFDVELPGRSDFPVRHLDSADARRPRHGVSRDGETRVADTGNRLRRYRADLRAADLSLADGLRKLGERVLPIGATSGRGGRLRPGFFGDDDVGTLQSFVCDRANRVLCTHRKPRSSVDAGRRQLLGRRYHGRSCRRRNSDSYASPGAAREPPADDTVSCVRRYDLDPDVDRASGQFRELERRARDLCHRRHRMDRRRCPHGVANSLTHVSLTLRVTWSAQERIPGVCPRPLSLEDNSMYRSQEQVEIQHSAHVAQLS